MVSETIYHSVELNDDYVLSDDFSPLGIAVPLLFHYFRTEKCAFKELVKK